MTILNVAYGIDSENGQEYYYVQTACNEEHEGQDCDCRDIAHYDNLEQAKEHAYKLSELLNVPVQYDNEGN